MTYQNGVWVLVEFVDGPSDGKIVRVEASTAAELTNGLIELVNSARNYRPVSMPNAAVISLDSWADRERSVVEGFEQGSPELYIQMVWDEHYPAARSEPVEEKRPQEEHDPSPEAFLLALLLGEGRTCQSMTERALSDGSVSQLIENLFAPAMTAVGEAWSRGQIAVSVEHRATSIVYELLSEHSLRTVDRPRGQATVAAVGEEWHALPTLMATAALREDRWDVEHLGAGLPADDLLTGALSAQTDLLVLSVTMEASRAHATETAEAVRSRGLPVLVGGAGQPISGLVRAARAVGGQ